MARRVIGAALESTENGPCHEGNLRVQNPVLQDPEGSAQPEISQEFHLPVCQRPAGRWPWRTWLGRWQSIVIVTDHDVGL